MVADALPWRRRDWLAAAAGGLGGCALPGAAPHAPVIFVHGNGDHAGLWLTTLWRFESNGWPRDRLHAINLPDPLARDLDDVAQPGRSSTAEHRDFLAAEVERLRRASGAAQVALVANSRGGNAVRHFAAGGGAALVTHAVLGGTPNHGVQIDPASRPMNEFNGAGPFLTRLNAQPGGLEVSAGPRWLTLRSDGNDKFAQPDGLWLGSPGKRTGVDATGPALKGAQDTVLPGVDHRETSFSAPAFDATWRFITGRAPATLTVVPESQVVLDGLVSGLGVDNDPARGGAPSNRALVGARVEVFEVDADTGARLGAAVWRKTIGSDGRWGPFLAAGEARYEFVLQAPGYATTHVYRGPFPRSSGVVQLRPELLLAADRGAAAVLVLTRPRGYFGLPRDRISFDGAAPAGVNPGVAGVSAARLRLADATPRAVAGRFNAESIVGRPWPAADGHLSVLELHS